MLNLSNTKELVETALDQSQNQVDIILKLMKLQSQIA